MLQRTLLLGISSTYNTTSNRANQVITGIFLLDLKVIIQAGMQQCWPSRFLFAPSIVESASLQQVPFSRFTTGRNNPDQQGNLLSYINVKCCNIFVLVWCSYVYVYVIIFLQDAKSNRRRQGLLSRGPNSQDRNGRKLMYRLMTSVVELE